MTSADTETMNALQTLLTERQRFEGWLRTLEERKASTPPHVFERVQNDYTLRLDAVLGRLAEHTEQVRATITEMSGELEQLRTRESDRIDERAEAELRAIVGEYPDDEWNRIRDEADLEIELMAEERRELETKLAELQRLLDSTVAPAGAASAANVDGANAGMDAAAQDALPEPPPMVAAAAGTMAAVEALESEIGAGETADAGVDAGVVEQGTNGTVEAVQNATGSTKQPNEVRPPSLDDFVDWPARKDQHASAAQNDDASRGPEDEDSMAATASAIGARNAARYGTGRADPMTEPRRDTEKTLKCPECGTLNYATEWYCERCGGELATF